jgi:hypothetical protein
MKKMFWSAALAAVTPVCILAQVIATGLDNPRGVAFDENGALYVVEAGRGGTGPCILASNNQNVCYGATGALTRVSGGTQQRVLTGLPSLAVPAGTAATGAHDIAIKNKNNVYLLIGLQAPPASRAQLGPAGEQFGTLVRANVQSGHWTPETDIAANEQKANPDGGVLDSNPYGLLQSGQGHVVADAGANALVNVGANKKTSTLTAFSPLPTAPPRQPVPTSVVLGPDGAYYVSLLSGAPFIVGAAAVLRVVPGQAPTVVVSGLTNVVDLAFRPQDGRLYVLEIAANAIPNFGTGSLIRIEANGTQTPIGPSLFAPGGLAFGPDGAAYVSVNSTLPGAGQVVAIPIP